ncbi:MAG: WXG100 family type VII secretion target, partial [Jatrophihabitantaceae bacterium]
MSNAQHHDETTGTNVPRHSHGYTDFNSHSHQELYQMLYASDPASIREAAAAWQSTGRMLADQAQQLKHRLVSFSQMWQGAAADEYQVMITDLANGLDKVGTGALAMNDLMASSAESLDKARAAMPPPSTVPDLDPQVVAAATAPPPAEIAMMPGAQAQFAASQQQAQQAVLAHQAQVDAAHSAQTQAAVVMHNLATEYGSTEDSVPAAPESVSTGPTSLPADGSSGLTPVGVQGTGTGLNPAGLPLDGSGVSGTAPSASVPNSPLFGHMFTAGLAAASAAASGRFGSVMPRLPGFLSGKKKDGSPAGSSAAAGVAARAAALRAAAAAKLCGGGGFGGA